MLIHNNVGFTLMRQIQIHVLHHSKIIKVVKTAPKYLLSYVSP